VKERHVREAKAKEAELLARFRALQGAVGPVSAGLDGARVTSQVD
jgi:hypothetical protein